jgi:hypothetical protein
MSKFRNETGSVLTVADLGIQVGPGERFEWPGHDVKVHGLIPGCAWLDAPDTPRSGDRSAVPGPADPEPAAPDADGTAPDDGAKPAAKHGKAGGQPKETAK